MPYQISNVTFTRVIGNKLFQNFLRMMLVQKTNIFRVNRKVRHFFNPIKLTFHKIAIFSLKTVCSKKIYPVEIAYHVYIYLYISTSISIYIYIYIYIYIHTYLYIYIYTYMYIYMYTYMYMYNW